MDSVVGGCHILYGESACHPTIITAALPALAQSFHTTAIDLNVGISAHLLALAIFIPMSGWMVDHFGALTLFVSTALFLIPQFRSD